MLILVTSDTDINEVVRLAQIIWREHYYPITGEEHVEYMLDTFQSFPSIKEQIADGCKYYLVKSNKTNCGYFAFQPEGEKAYLSKAYLLSEYRGKGFFSKMLSFMKTEAKKSGSKSMYLTVNRDNANSVAVYTKCGFKITEAKKIPIGGGHYKDDYIMELDLMRNA